MLHNAAINVFTFSILCCVLRMTSSEELSKSDNNKKGFFIGKWKEQVKDINKVDKQAQTFIKEGESISPLHSKSDRSGFLNGFIASIYVIIISELGDKTFFIAAIMSIRNSRVVVYAGAMAALASMTVLSAGLGYATTIIPRKFTYYLSGVLFAAFGLKMLKDAYEMSPTEGQEEYEEVQADIKKREETYFKDNSIDDVPVDLETGVLKTPPQRHRWIFAFCSKVLIEAFVLTFLAEWGDRSQVTTIILAATKDVMGVIVGGTIGHALCTGVAVIAGRIVAQKIPIRWLTVIGAVTFLLFAVSTFIIKPDSNS